MIRFRPEQADSIGIILHYECTYRCAHCLYACRPGLAETIELETYNRLLDSISRACPKASLHIGGGEPFLHMDRLVHVIRLIKKGRFFLEYVETNGFWIKRPEAKNLLLSVKKAGCQRALLSISPFHNAFLSCRDNKQAYRMIVEVFGPQGIFPWHPEYYPFLERGAPDRTVPIKEYFNLFSEQEIAEQLSGIIHLHPAGRAPLNLAPFIDRFPGESYFKKQCQRELSSPIHAHVDPYGHYLAGFCTGLQIGDQEAFHLEALFQEGILLEKFPLLEILVAGNLGDLFLFAQGKGFRLDPAGYISACHLCGHIRTWLYHHLPAKKRPKELAPNFFYEEMDLLFHKGKRNIGI